MATASLPRAGTRFPLQTVIIRRKGDFESLLAGFTRLRAITYVATPELLLSLFEKSGFESLDVIVGENLTGSYRENLSRKTLDVTDRLATLIEAGQLQIFVPDRSIHTKLYILEKPGITRLIQTSANLTETAYNASHQINYAWCLDLSPDDPWAIAVVRDYEAHITGCSLFMGDLIKLIRQAGDGRHEIIEAWLRGKIIADDEAEATRVLQDMSRQALLDPSNTEEQVISVRLPDEEHARAQMEKFLQPLNAVIGHNEAHVQGPSYIRYVNERHNLPLMQVDYGNNEIKLGLRGTIRLLTERLPEPSVVSGSLAHIESYFDTVHAGQSTNPRFAKTAMYEALLYFLWSPFATTYMADRRSRYGQIESRGPRFLYLYGPAQNGKTTFLRFAMKLLTGHLVEPLTGSDFTKTRIKGSSSVGTTFPLVFDDLTPSKDFKKFEEILKSYWEVWWRHGYVFPQIVITSNTESLPEWAKSRLKHVDFDVHFAPNESDKQKLAGIFSAPNDLFHWFSGLYFEESARAESFSDDELSIARRCVQRLYEYSKRDIPDYFPREPLEKLFDPGLKRWRDVLFELKLAKTHAEGGRILIEFKTEMDRREIRQYQGHLPQTVKCTNRGNMLIIESPKIFEDWLHGRRNHQGKNLPRRFLGYLRAKTG